MGRKHDEHCGHKPPVELPPVIEYEPETLHGADIMVFRGENFTDSDYMPLPGSESKKDTNQ